MLAVMFVAFIVQIVFRYVFNLPVGWTSELTRGHWLWLVLWGAAFVLKDDEEIRIDLLSGAAGRARAASPWGSSPRWRSIVLFGLSLKASFDYVTFMKVEKTSYLKIRMDWLYSIYVVFVVAVIARYLWLLVAAAARQGSRRARLRPRRAPGL